MVWYSMVWYHTFVKGEIMKEKQVAGYVTEEEHNDLRHIANIEQRSLSYIVRAALLEYMSKRMPPPEGDPVDDSEPSSVPNSKPDNEHTDNNGFDLGDVKY